MTGVMRKFLGTHQVWLPVAATVVLIGFFLKEGGAILPAKVQPHPHPHSLNCTQVAEAIKTLSYQNTQSMNLLKTFYQQNAENYATWIKILNQQGLSGPKRNNIFSLFDHQSKMYKKAYESAQTEAQNMEKYNLQLMAELDRCLIP